MNQELVWRDEVRSEDGEIIRRLCQSSGFFSTEEVHIAMEMVEERLGKGLTSGYYFLFAQYGSTVLGYSCYGPIPCTESSWDLYWIAIEDKRRGQGLGRKLETEVERRIVLLGGRRVYVWTSSRKQYLPTRSFYEHLGYTQEATLRNYYKSNEHLIIFVKGVSKFQGDFDR